MKKTGTHFCLPVLLAAGLSVAHAHGVTHAVERDQALVVRLAYSNGKPYAHEEFALYAAGAGKPHLKGRTDAAGRAVFIPGEATRWRFETHARHGHGTVFDFTVPAVVPPPAPAATAATQEPGPPPPPVAATPVPDGPSQASLALFGLSLVFGGFGVYQLFLRRRQT